MDSNIAGGNQRSVDSVSASYLATGLDISSAVQEHLCDVQVVVFSSYEESCRSPLSEVQQYILFLRIQINVTQYLYVKLSLGTISMDGIELLWSRQ